MDETTGQTAGSQGLGADTKQQAQAVVDQGKDLAGQGKELAGQLVDKARDQVRTSLSGQMDTVCETLEGVAEALTLTSDHLRDQGKSQIGEYGDRAAHSITKASAYLKERDLDQIVRETGDFARQKPALAFGIAVAAGVIAARFLKSTSQAVSTSTSSNGNGNGYASYGNGYASSTSHALVPTESYGTPAILPDFETEEADPSGVRPSDGD